MKRTASSSEVRLGLGDKFHAIYRMVDKFGYYAICGIGMSAISMGILLIGRIVIGALMLLYSSNPTEATVLAVVGAVSFLYGSVYQWWQDCRPTK